jgi:hypothetical protein
MEESGRMTIECDPDLVKTKVWQPDEPRGFWLFSVDDSKYEFSGLGGEPRRKEYIQVSRNFKKRGDELVRDGELREAMVQYRLAGYMLRKDAFFNLECRASYFKYTPEPDTRDLCLEIWLAASKLSARLGQEPEQEWLHVESMSIAEFAYHLSRRCVNPKVEPSLLLRIKLQYADVLQEAQREYVQCVSFAPAASYADLAFSAEDERRRDQSRITTRFHYGQSILASAASMCPFELSIQEKLGACIGLRAIIVPRERTLRRKRYRQIPAIAGARPSDRSRKRYEEAHLMVHEIITLMFSDADETAGLLQAMDVGAMDVDEVVGELNVDEIDEIKIKVNFSAGKRRERAKRRRESGEMEDDVTILSTTFAPILGLNG